MKYCVTLFLVLTSFLIACNSNESKEVRADSSHIENETAIVKDEDAFPQEALAFINGTGFSKYARSTVPQLDWSKFSITRFWKENFVVKSEFIPDKNYFDAYGQFLKYSPDSSKFIDLDSYNIDIQKDRRGQLVGTDDGPDTEVSLVDIKQKQRTRLVFMGPGNSVEDATWLDNENLILIGFQESATGDATNAVVWKFNLTTKMVYLYELGDEKIVGQLKDYSKKERLKSVKMR